MTAPVTSKILGADGKPIVTQQPVRVEHEASLTTTFYLIPKLRQGETNEDWARRCGRVDDVRMP
jgi:hypothetical protein